MILCFRPGTTLPGVGDPILAFNSASFRWPTMEVPETTSSCVATHTQSQKLKLKQASDHGPTPVVRGINCDLHAGDLALVSGAVGSGKTALLMAILGELDRTGGDASFGSTTAFVQSQMTASFPLLFFFVFGELDRTGMA